ncbi:MAG TPA: exosortase [Tepidisphaeraceae bacterium]
MSSEMRAETNPEPKAVLTVEEKAPPAFPWALMWFGGLLLVCYAPVLYALVKNWNSDADMGHGFFVPIIAAYIAWQKRAEIAATPAQPNWWGLPVVLYGALQLCIATLGAELFTARTAFLVSLVGMVLLLGGTKYLKIFAFPLFLLLFMIPIPAIIYNRITFPLQMIASELAEKALSLLQIPVLREGNVLELPDQTLNVVEACSGIRSLLSLSFLSLVFGYFFEKRIWIRVVLFLSTIPIAIVANAARVTLTGILAETKPELAEGFFHAMSGWIIFMVALAILALWHQVLVKGTRLASR